MRVIVIGGGVVGVTTAYWLALEGARVTVVEREASLASLASYATGGHIAPGHSGAWASPRSLRTLIRSIYRSDLSYRLHPRPDLDFGRWALAYARQCTPQRYRYNTGVKIRLAKYSRERLIEIRDQTGLTYDGAAQGAVFFYRSEVGLRAASMRVRLWRDAGIDLRVLDGAGLRELDARLDPVARQAAGALYSPIDEVGDTRLFTHRLADIARAHGVEFRLGTSASKLERDGGSITGVTTDAGTLRADSFVLATGGASRDLTAGLGFSLPVFPIRGYSVTVPARGESIPPIGMVDEEGLVAIARLGDRIRLGGTAEFGRTDRRMDPGGIDRLVRIGRGLFPEGAHWDRPDPYVCLRPMTADGPPVIGRSPIANLFLNVGHGHIGWTMAAGAGKVVSDLVAGRSAAIDLEGMTLSRSRD
ncbi:MAG: D-amino acid dehydrogenase [Chloroflexota bacterium]|nr:D-amino acid dehydrogenase [Chloroflexota bacterium]MDQ3689180.1 D-amino acid dehydrogenase [Chloroflexota bacterium]